MSSTSTIQNTQPQTCAEPAQSTDRRRRRQISDHDIINWHIEEYQLGDSLTTVAQRHGIGRAYLSIRFQRLGLPVAHKLEHRAYKHPEEDHS